MKSGTFKTMYTPFVALCSSDDRKKIKEKPHVITRNPAGIYLLKVNNTNTKTRCEICSKLTIKISERRK